MAAGIAANASRGRCRFCYRWMSLHRELGKAETKEGTEGTHPQPMNQKLKYKKSSLRMSVTSLWVPYGEKEQ